MWIDRVQYIALYQRYWKYRNGVYNYYSFILWGVYDLTFGASSHNLGVPNIPKYSKPEWEEKVFSLEITTK